MLRQHLKHHSYSQLGFKTSKVAQRSQFTDENGKFQNIDSEEFDSPINLESRNEWQKRLDTSKFSDKTKECIKHIENLLCDHWSSHYDNLWDTLNKRLDVRMPLDEMALRETISNHLKKQVDSIPVQKYVDLFSDLYADGKLSSYKFLKFDDIKRNKLKKKTSSVKIAITVDTVEERRLLDQLAESALSKVKDTVSNEMKERIMKELNRPGSYGDSAVELANKIIREERKKLDNEMADAPDAKKEELRERIRALYEEQQYNIQRIMRTETINAYAVSTLRGYKEQGIEKVKWNSHNDNRTCNICLSLNGIEFGVDELLSKGDLPIAETTHPQCRCFLTPVVSFVTFDEFEKQYKDSPTDFAPSETVVDTAQIEELADIIQNLQTRVSEIKNLPVEFIEPVSSVMNAIEGSEYANMMPKEIHIVPDAANTDDFKKKVGDEIADSMQGQVTEFTSDNNTSYVSGFSMKDEKPSASFVRVWAKNIWDQDLETRRAFDKSFDQAQSRSRPEDISPSLAQNLVETLDPYAVARRVQIGPVEGVTFNKKFKGDDEERVRSILQGAGATQSEIESILKWRSEYVIYDLDSGGVIESDRPVNANTFVSEVAALDPYHYFVESMVSYYTMPLQLKDRDPEMYEFIGSRYYGNKEFENADPTKT